MSLNTSGRVKLGPAGCGKVWFARNSKHPLCLRRGNAMQLISPPSCWIRKITELVSNRQTSISPSLGYEINYISSEQMEFFFFFFLREDANIYVFMPFCVFIQMCEYSKTSEEFNVLKSEVINIVNYLPSVTFWTLLWPVFHGCAYFVFQRAWVWYSAGRSCRRLTLLSCPGVLSAGCQIIIACSSW